jgi:hypothetical protein
MNQSFMTQFPWGEKTHFIEKLWRMALNESLFTQSDLYEFGRKYFAQCGFEFENPMHYHPKLHTIRGFSDRYKVGQMQQPFIWTGKPYKEPIFRFTPLLPLVSKQKIEIIWLKRKHVIGRKPFVVIDGRLKYPDKLRIIAQNDGFINVDDFFRWFNKDFEGEIRHYTDLIY